MWHSYSVVPIAFIVLLSGGQAGARTEDAKHCASVALPANLSAPRDWVPVLEQMYRGSSTFRAQCVRISDASNLSVSIRLDTAMLSLCRAFSLITRRQRIIRAEVHLPPTGTMFAELVGHEFEHIVEQVEGIDLRELARVKGSGVHEVQHELFETDRAQRTGRIVGDEVRASRAAHPSAD
jgi:hypothetical protein